MASYLPFHRPQATHKYQQGHLLLVGGSKTYAGSILLATVAAKCTGVGMISVAVPERFQDLILNQAPDVLVIPCPETPSGAIAQFPENLDLERFDAIACGPGLTTAADTVVRQVLASDAPLVLDADALNILAMLGSVDNLSQRKAPTILTPHPGEFRRLFPSLLDSKEPSPPPDKDTRHPPLPTKLRIVNRAVLSPQAASQTGAIVLLKGARSVVATPDGRAWINRDSTPGLARGGSGDILTGLIGGLLGQIPPREATLAATYWHAQAGRLAAESRTVLGVDAWQLQNFLTPVLVQLREMTQR